PPVAIEHYRDLEIVFAISGGWKPDRRQEVGFKLVIRNTSDKTIELKWPSAKTHDFVVRNAKRKIIWRWSKDKSFAQAFKTKTLKSGSKMVIKSIWDQKTNSGKTTPRGKYTIWAEFNPMSYSKKLGPLGIRLVK
ncbi:hypothetical protein LCGC14_2929770, partial [marine sediment metagenome]